MRSTTSSFFEDTESASFSLGEKHFARSAHCTDVGEIVTQSYNNIFDRIKTDLFDQRRAEFNIFVSVLINQIRKHDSPYTIEDSRINFEIAESVNK